MSNTIELAKSFVPKLDECYRLASLTSVLDGAPELAKQGANANELIIPMMSMDGLADYSRNGGYVQGGVTMTNETVKCNFDRGRRFDVDVMDDLETAGLAFGRLSAQFIRDKVVPELDAFRFASYCGISGVTKKEETLAIGAVVDCSRGEIIRIVPAPQRASGLIGTDRRLQDGSKVTLLALVTAVSVTAHRYIPGEASEELYKDTLEPGTYRVTFDAPAVADSLAVRGAELSERGVNHCTLTVSKAAEVCVTGRKYSDSATVLRREASNLPSNAQGNEVSVPDATLVSPDRAAAVAARVLDYYAQRYEQTFRMVAGDEKLADRLIVESFGGEMVRGVVTKLEFDLTGGFLADAKIVGRKLSNNAAAYAGEEIHAGERSFI